MKYQVGKFWEKKIEVEILQEKIPKCEDSFWYDGNIAFLKFGKRELMVMACGEIAIRENKTGELVHDGWKERNSGVSYRLKTDKDLRKIGSQGDRKKYYWDNNNWFEIAYRMEGDEYWDTVMGECMDNYDGAIESAISWIKDNNWWADLEAKRK